MQADFFGLSYVPALTFVIMASLRRHKSLLYARLAALPLHLMGVDARMPSLLRTRPLYYLLKGHRPVGVPFWRYQRWIQQASGTRHRATLTIARSRAGAYTVSTIFLGLDHSFMGEVPVLFETMAFSRREDGRGTFRDEQYRYRTWAEAIRGHRQLQQRLASVKLVNA